MTYGVWLKGHFMKNIDFEKIEYTFPNCSNSSVSAEHCAYILKYKRRRGPGFDSPLEQFFVIIKICYKGAFIEKHRFC